VSLRVESGMEDGSGVILFDGHNDAVQFIAEYGADGRDFLERSDDGHLDIVRAREGGLIGGIFAIARQARTRARGRPHCIESWV